MGVRANRIDPSGRDAVILVGRNKIDPEYFTKIANLEASAYRQFTGKKAHVFQVRSVKDVQDALKTPAIDELVYFGHACSSSLYLSEDELSTEDVKKLDFSNVENPAYIALFGCSTACGPDSVTIAGAFANKLNQPVIGLDSGLSFGIPLRFGKDKEHSLYLGTLFPGILRGDIKVVTPKNYVPKAARTSYADNIVIPIW